MPAVAGWCHATSRGARPARLVRQRPQHAELVALGVRQHDPADVVTLADVDGGWRQGRRAARPRRPGRRGAGRGACRFFTTVLVLEDGGTQVGDDAVDGAARRRREHDLDVVLLECGASRGRPAQNARASGRGRCGVLDASTVQSVATRDSRLATRDWRHATGPRRRSSREALAADGMASPGRLRRRAREDDAARRRREGCARDRGQPGHRARHRARGSARRAGTSCSSRGARRTCRGGGSPASGFAARSPVPSRTSGAPSRPTTRSPPRSSGSARSTCS